MRDDRMILPPVLDTGAAPDLLANVRQRLDVSPMLRIDASGVETITLACMQIVLAALSSGPGVRLEQPSVAFAAAFADLGIPIDSHEPERDDAREMCAENEQSAMSKRILTIDDSKTIRDMLRLTLLDAGFEVLQAVDGQDGVDVLAWEQVDLVISDIILP
jgi:CheY-like chemotaxis protein